jgi:hypothetical protein
MKKQWFGNARHGLSLAVDREIRNMRRQLKDVAVLTDTPRPRKERKLSLKRKLLIE